MSEKKKRCFIITPIGSETEPIRRHIDGIIKAAIRPALEYDYDVVVAHELAEPGSITKQIITEIHDDELVVANLTDRNPNVMYELAFRHSLGKPVIMIAEKGTNLPSDIVMERTIFYRNDALGVLELREKLKEAVDGIDFDQVSSPIHDVIHDLSITETLRDATKKTGTDVENADAFEYILQRLDGIERKLRLNSQATEAVQYKCCYTFNYGEEVLGIDSTSVLDEFVSEDRVPGMHLTGYNIDHTSSNITFEAIANRRVPLRPRARYFIETLSRAGFLRVAAGDERFYALSPGIIV